MKYQSPFSGKIKKNIISLSSLKLAQRMVMVKIHLLFFQPLFSRETTFVTSCLLSCIPSPFRKGVYSKMKEFAPIGSKFFPFRGDPFPERTKQFDKNYLPSKCIRCPLKICQSSQTDFFSSEFLTKLDIQILFLTVFWTTVI